MKLYTLNDISIKHTCGEIVYYERFRIIIEQCTRCFERFAIQTHFVKPGEDIMEYLKKYVLPIYQQGDILIIGEKIASLCSSNVVHESEVKVGFWANFLSRFAYSSKSGRGAAEPRKLQLTINIVGLPRVIWAAFCAGIAKIFRIRGTFYRIVGHNINRMDGFCSPGDNCPSFEYYNHVAVLPAKNAGEICEQVEKELGIVCAVADANDLEVEMVGRSSSVQLTDKQIALALRDNPSGQDDECTPLVLLRECYPEIDKNLDEDVSVAAGESEEREQEQEQEQEQEA
jgi:hypothetical protein